MARLEVTDHELVLRMGSWEKVGALHGEVRVPLASVREVRAVAQGRSEIRGIRAPGTGLPGVILLGTMRGSFGKDFSVLYGNRPAVVIDLEGQEFERLLVSDAEADRTVERLQEAIHRPE